LSTSVMRDYARFDCRQTESSEVPPMVRLARICIILLLSVFVVATGCARSPDAKKARHLERGDKYFSRAQYREAVIEYANVLQVDRANPRAIRQLAIAHYQLGQIGQAFPYLIKQYALASTRIVSRLMSSI